MNSKKLKLLEGYGAAPYYSFELKYLLNCNKDGKASPHKRQNGPKGAKIDIGRARIRVLLYKH